MAENSNEEQAKIHIDDDWKTEAKKEKEKLSEKEKGAEGTGRGETRELPPASFETLVSTFATQAMISMGLINHPDAQKMVNLELAKFNIDLLGVIEEKTAEKLTSDEKALLDQTLHQLRMAFVQVSSTQSGPIGR